MSTFVTMNTTIKELQKMDYSYQETKVNYLEKKRKLIQKSISDLQTHGDNIDLRLVIERETLGRIRKQIPLHLVDGAEKSSAKDGCARTKGIDFKKRKIDEV